MSFELGAAWWLTHSRYIPLSPSTIFKVFFREITAEYLAIADIVLRQFLQCFSITNPVVAKTTALLDSELWILIRHEPDDLGIFLNVIQI